MKKHGRLYASVLCALALLYVRKAIADPATEAKAMALQNNAMTNALIINVNAAGATRELQLALQLCENNRCRLTLRAALNRDMGTVLAGYLNATRHEDAVSAFVDALKLDTSITPNRGLPMYRVLSSTVEPAFAEARQVFARWFWRQAFGLAAGLFTRMIAWFTFP